MFNFNGTLRMITTLTFVYLTFIPKLFSDDSDVYKQ